MSIDPAALRRAVATHGAVARILVLAVRGSAPREAGASMQVWADGQAGTIGGGALEFDAIRQGREMLMGDQRTRLLRQALGPDLGQCCGGSVTLLIEVIDDSDVAQIESMTQRDGVFARPISASAGSRPTPVAPAREPLFKAGWVIEPLEVRHRHVWIYGAGHVGRALVTVMADIPRIALTWVDVDKARFPDCIPATVDPLIAVNPADSVRHADDAAHHLVMTYSHAFDLEICDRILGRGFRSLGLIGSATKLARFRRRLAESGHSDAQIKRILCPIGNPDLGRDPQSIAIGVAARFLAEDEG